MKNSEVVIGTKYITRVSGNITVVEILAKLRPKGWRAKNLRTNREIYFKTAGRLWHPATKKSMEVYLGFVPIDTSHQALAQVILDLTESLTDARNMSYKTGINEDRCEEIFAIGNKLLDTLE